MPPPLTCAPPPPPPIIIGAAADSLDGDSHGVHLAVWHGVNLALVLSGVALAAGATLFLGAGSAGIYHVDTLLEARGRGFASALTARALREVEGLGYRWGVLSASTLGTPVYLRLGFRVVGSVVVFVGGAH